MTPTERLIRLIEEAGYENVWVLPARGFWRRQDVFRWEAHATRQDGLPVWFYSWDRITDCGRGIWITEDDGPLRMMVSGAPPRVLRGARPGEGESMTKSLRLERFPCGCEVEHSSDPGAYQAFVAAGGSYARCEKYRSIIACAETGGEPWSRINPLLNEHLPRRLKGAVVEVAMDEVPTNEPATGRAAGEER